MNLRYKQYYLFALIILISLGCASKKRKSGEPSALSKFYHNTTAYYNGYFNANELLQDSYTTMEQAHKDDYTEIISVYNYTDVQDAKIVNPDLDKAIEKVVKVAKLHEVSDWVDDCYVLMGEAQYLKQDYETAEETLVYFQEDFNPNNPYGRNASKGISKEEKKEIRAEARELREEQKEKEREAREAEREAREKAREEEKEARKKAREAERERRKKEREARKKARERERKSRGGKRTREVRERPETKEETTKQEISDDTEKSLTSLGEKKKESAPEVRSGTQDVEEEPPSIDALIREREKAKEKKRKNKTAYEKGLLLLAQTYVMRDNYSSAEFLLNQLSSSADEHISRTIPVVQADIYIREENYDAAITQLEIARELADRKELEARYSFILGQLYLRKGNVQKASEYFDSAESLAKNFEMRFASLLNREKAMLFAGKKSKEAVNSDLEKMLKEDKYREQRDQIYFTMGEINLKSKDYDEAVANFTESINKNVNNASLKTKAYFNLAQLYLDREDYVQSYNYFDSTSMVIQKTDPKFAEVLDYKKNLKEIAHNTQIINENDSLLNLTKLSDAELMKMAEDQVSIAIEAEEKVAEPRERKSKARIFTTTTSAFGESDFPFYDAQVRENGKDAFERKWGNRALVDNWRTTDDRENRSLDDDIVEETNDKINRQNEVDKKFNELKSKIPYSVAQRKLIENKMEYAYYNLGSLLRTNLNNIPKSTEALETLVQDYPETIKLLDAYYYLYINHRELGNTEKSNYYKNKIKTDFPDSRFSQVIDDPTFAESIMSQEKQLEQAYRDIYALFQNARYDKVLDRIKNVDTQFGMDHDLNRKFRLLEVMATGSQQGKDVYINGLKNYVTKYRNTEEATRADELLRILTGGQGVSGSEVKAADNKFILDEDELHYVIVVFDNITFQDLTQAKIDISNYNLKYYKSEKLRLGTMTLDREKHNELVMVRKFDNKDRAMKYYNSTMKSLDEFITLKDATYRVYAISQTNNRRLLQDQSDERYRDFFRENYL